MWLLLAIRFGVAHAGEAEVGWDDHLYFHTDELELELEAVLQPRFEAALSEGELTDAAFFMRRTRLTFAGEAYDRASFKVQLAWDRGQAYLADAVVGLTVGEHTELRVGQHKRYFSRQFITSGTKLALPDRAITGDTFDIGRDIGVQLVHESALEAAVGVFNGTGDRAPLRGDVIVDPETGVGEVELGRRTHAPVEPFHPMLTGRLGAHTEGMKAFDEVDFEGGGLRLAGAVQGLVHFDLDGDDSTTVETGADAMVKISGWTFETEGYAGFAGDGQLGDLTLDQVGGHAQASWLLGAVAPAVRVARVTDVPDRLGTTRIDLGLGWYGQKHALSWKNAVIGIMPDEEPTELVVQSQLQLLL